MSKYNLKDLLIEGMSDAEFKDAGEASRLEKHPEGDKIAKIKAMMAKEKSMKENYQMDGEVYDRIDGLINNELKRKFIFIFEDIYDDFLEQGEEFEVDDVVDFLTICLDKHSKENNMDDLLPGGSFNEGAKYYEDDNRKDSPVEKETEKMRMKEGDSIVDEREFDFFTAILDGRYSEDQIESYLKSEDYKMALDEFQLEDSFASDWIQEFANYYGDGADAYLDESDTKLKEHFNRFK